MSSAAVPPRPSTPPRPAPLPCPYTTSRPSTRRTVCFSGFNLGAIWSSFVQSAGTKQGAFFDPITMKPLVNNDAMRAALELYAQLKAYGARACLHG